MLPRQPFPSRGGFFSRGISNRNNNYRQGRRFRHRDLPPQFPSLIQPQPMVLYINYGQVLRAATNYKTGYVLGKVPLSIYTPLETNTLGYTSQDHSY